LRLLRVTALTAPAVIGCLLLALGSSAVGNGGQAFAAAEPAPRAQHRSIERPLPVPVPIRRVAPAVRPVAAPAVPAVRRPAVVRKAVTKPARTTRAVVKTSPVVVADAYPYRTSQTNAPDAWGFTQRQCVSYAAWRLAQAGTPVSQVRDAWGSASNWDDTARRLGRTVDSRPAIGAIAQWNPGESSTVWVGSSTGHFSAGGYGHVAYVTGVFADGSVQVAQYNVTGNRTFSTMHLRAPRYLHI
jgi:surface antigen